MLLLVDLSFLDKNTVKQEQKLLLDCINVYDGKCNAYAGAIFLDLISNFERIGDHSTNIAESVIENYSA